jgi:ribosomal protein S18 acetylase RimI-like enzyme
LSATAPLILVVDDDAGSRKAMALTLQTDGRRVEEFADADGALERAMEDPTVALRKLEDGIGEMKRLWVRPAFRGTRLGRRLVEAVLAEARAAGYRAVRLDTLPSMRAAQVLYVSLGFVDIPPYNDHPIEGTRFMELLL